MPLWIFVGFIFFFITMLPVVVFSVIELCNLAYCFVTDKKYCSFGLFKRTNNVFIKEWDELHVIFYLGVSSLTLLIWPVHLVLIVLFLVRYLLRRKKK